MHQRLASVADIDKLERAVAVVATEAWPSHFTGQLALALITAAAAAEAAAKAVAAALTTSVDCGRRIDEHCQRH